MSRFITGGAVAALALAACAFAGSASAQTYNRLVVFGDSLSDNGNLYLISGGTQPPSPPYARRFSNGPTFVELLGFNAANFNGSVTGSINYAFGGSRTDASAGVPFGMLNQLSRYTAAGGRFSSTDLVSVLGGANDIFQGLPAAGASASPVAAITPVATGAARQHQHSGQHRGGGGRRDHSGHQPAQAQPDAPVSGNGRRALGRLRRHDLQHRPADGADDHGRRAAGQQHHHDGPVQDRRHPGRQSRPVRHHQHHPDLLQRRHGLFEPRQLFLLRRRSPDGGRASDHRPTGDRLPLLRRYRRPIDPAGRNDLSPPRGCAGRGQRRPVGSSAVGGGRRRHHRRPDRQRRHRCARAGHKRLQRRWGARIALEAGPSANWRFGLAGSARKTDVDSQALRFNVESFGLDVYGGWRSNDVFVNAAVGVARDNIDDIERTTSLAPIVHTAETRALSTGARLQGGMWFDMGGVALSPRAALGYVSSDVDGYYERGVAAQYQYGDRTVKALTGEVSLRAEAEMGRFGLFAEGGYRDALDDSSRSGPRRPLQQPGPGPVARDRRSVRRSVPGVCGAWRARSGRSRSRSAIAAVSATTPTATWAASS